MKFTKRIATTALAGAMAMSLAVPAFAAANETKITAKYAETKIDVVVPTTGTATINPYKLEVSVKKSNDTTKEIKGQQIVTQPLAIVNKSKMKLNVDATVTCTETGTFKFVEADFDDSDPDTAPKTNTAFVWVEAKATKLASANMEDGKVKQDDLIDEFAGWAATDSGSAPDGEGGFCVVTAPAKSGDPVTLSASQPKDTHLVSLAAGKPNAQDATQIDVQSGGIAMFRLSGHVVKSPTTAWKTTDGFTATIAFTFEPDFN